MNKILNSKRGFYYHQWVLYKLANQSRDVENVEFFLTLSDDIYFTYIVALK